MEPVQIYLRRGLERGTLHHALLMSGPKRVDIAYTLVRELIGTTDVHPDLHVYDPEGKMGVHSIEMVRMLIEEVYKPPFSASRKVFLIHAAERMVPAAAHALLKTLEEPELDSTILLLTDFPEALLPTLVSRCVHLRTQKEEEKGSSDAAAHVLEQALIGALSRFQAIEELETLWKDLEGAELHHAVHKILIRYLDWIREQEQQGEDHLETALAKVDQIQYALERNVRWTACLDQLLST
jgi:DNA polymerase III delta prime subunit